MRILTHIVPLLTAVAGSLGLASVAHGEAAAAAVAPTEARPPDGLPRPADGSAPLRNPPAFIWPPVEGAAGYDLQVSTGADFAGDATETAGGIPLSVYNPPRRLAPGRWYWRCRALSADGKPSEWSAARSFTLGPGALAFEVPALDALVARVPVGHPRLFVTPAGLDAFRARRHGPAKGAWIGLDAEARGLLGGALPAEPLAASDGKADTAWAVSLAAGDRAELLAFVALVGGEKRFADEARRLLLHLCSWDPGGATGDARHPEAASTLLLKLSRAYDWAHHALSQADRDRVLAALRARGEAAFRQLRQARPEAHPDDAGLASLLAALAEAALALYGDLPEARAWLEYAVPVTLALSPAGGAEDGGWPQGMRDWAWSVPGALLHAEALRSALGVDLLSLPWYRSAGYFKLYAHPLRSGAPAGYPDAPAGLVDRLGMERLAASSRDGRLQWYAGRVAGDYGGIAAYLWKGEQPAARPPADLPQARLFAETGVAALHTRLWEPAGDVAFLFRSSPQGSWGQAHAEQNTFTLDAFGEPLAVASGWAAWESDAALREWMHQTAAHNGLLVSGHGQPIQSRTAAGRIAAFHTGGDYDYVVGDAARAYPGMLTRFIRRVLFVRPRLFVILDEAEAPVRSRLTWTLHALGPMQIDAAAQSALLRRGKAGLLARWLAPERLTLAQSDRLPIPDEKASAATPRQWHLSVTTADEVNAERFLTLLAPFRGDPEGRVPAAERVDSDRAVGVRAGGDLVGFRTSQTGGPAILGDVESDGEAFATHRGPSGQVTQWFVASGSRLAAGGMLLFSLPTGSTGAAGVEGDRVEAVLDLRAGGEVALRIPVAPRRVLLGGQPVSDEGFTYDGETHLLRLRVPAGHNRLVANLPVEAPLPAAPTVEIALPSTAAPAGERRSAVGGRTQPAVEKRSVLLSLMRSVEGSLVAYGVLPTPAGPYRLEGSDKSAVQVGGRPAGEKGIVWTTGPAEIQVEAAAAEMPRVLRLSPIPLGPGLPGQPIPAQAISWPGTIRVEAETVAEQIAGEAQPVTGNESLSGGAGLSGWETPGHSLTWRFRVPRAGQYLLMLKGAAVGSDACRLIRYDDRYSPDAWRPVRFAAGAAIDGVPDWSPLFRVTEPVALSAGEHTVTLTALSGAMDLDLLAFQPAE